MDVKTGEIDVRVRTVFGSRDRFVLTGCARPLPYLYVVYSHVQQVCDSRRKKGWLARAARPQREGKMSVTKRGRHIVALAILLVGLVACATPGPVLTESVGTLRTGINTAREQSRLAFEAANSIARDQAIERKVDDARAVSIAESDFPQIGRASCREREENSLGTG